MTEKLNGKSNLQMYQLEVNKFLSRLEFDLDKRNWGNYGNREKFGRNVCEWLRYQYNSSGVKALLELQQCQDRKSLEFTRGNERDIVRERMKKLGKILRKLN